MVICKIEKFELLFMVYVQEFVVKCVFVGIVLFEIMNGKVSQVKVVVGDKLVFVYIVSLL